MYEFFYDLAVYISNNWKGSYTPKEMACNAYTYLCDCQASTPDSLVGSMVVVKQFLTEDMDLEIAEAEYFLNKLNDYLAGKVV